MPALCPPPFLSPSLSPFGSRILSRVVQSTDPISQHCRRPSCSYLLVLVAGYVANFRREGFGCKMSRAFSVFWSFVSVQDSPRLLQNAVGERAHEAVSLWKMLMNSFSYGQSVGAIEIRVQMRLLRSQHSSGSIRSASAYCFCCGCANNQAEILT